MQNQAIQQEALSRAVSGQSFSNFRSIFEGFMRMGIAESEIKPRENVFTYNAWRALGRQVRKGEHGVKCLTFIEATKTDRRTGEKESFRRPWSTTVFHVSQTDAIGTAALPASNPVAVLYPDAATDTPDAWADQPDATGENVPFAGEDKPTAHQWTPETGLTVVDPLAVLDDSVEARVRRGEPVNILDMIPARVTPRVPLSQREVEF
jgi:hypothetical protein